MPIVLYSQVIMTSGTGKFYQSTPEGCKRRCRNKVFRQLVPDQMYINWKIRLPTVDSLKVGITRWLVFAERSWLPSTQISYSVERSKIYRGALSCRSLYASSEILY